MSGQNDPYYRRNPHTAWQIMDDGGLILDLRAHELTATNATGAVIWQALDEPRTPQQLSAALARDFEVTPDAALTTVYAFLDALQAKALIEPVPAEPGA